MLHERIEQAIQRTIPKQAGQRHRQIFELARELKAIREIADAPAKELRAIVKQWHQRALPAIATKPLVETLVDFGEAWDKVKYPAGSGAIDVIFSQADISDLPAATADYDQREALLLVALCRELQRAAGDNPFFLDCRTAGRLLGVHHTTAWRWLRLLIHDGILKGVSAGSLKERRANRYRYLAKL